MRINRLAITKEHMKDLENLAYVTCRELNITDLFMDIIQTGEELVADAEQCLKNPADINLQKQVAVRGIFELHDFFMRNKKLMEQMEGIFGHFENIPLIDDEEEKDE